MRNLFSKLKTAVAVAALCSLAFSSFAAAQTNEQMGTGTTTQPSTQPSTQPAARPPASNGPFVVRIQSPVSGTRVAGNVTFTGAAVDCGRGIAATRVAVYQGVDANGTYVADASMDTQRAIGRYCSTQAGTEKIGFTLIYNTRNLRDGPMTLSFVAEFPGVAPQITTTEVIIDNIGPRYRYDPYYNDGGYYRGYGGYYGYNGYQGYAGYSGYYPYNNYCSGYYGGSCGGNYSSYPVYSGSYAGYYGGLYTGCYLYGATCTTGGGAYYNYYNYGNPYYNNYNYGYNYGYPYYNNYSVYNYGGYYNPYVYGGGCVYPYGAVNCGAGYGYTNITLNQAGQTVRSTGPQVLTGFATCSTGGVTTVTVYDRSTGTPVLIGTSSGANYGVSWTPGAPLGARTIQVVAQGACGTFSQSFSVIVIA